MKEVFVNRLVCPFVRSKLIASRRLSQQHSILLIPSHVLAVSGGNHTDMLNNGQVSQRRNSIDRSIDIDHCYQLLSRNGRLV